MKYGIRECCDVVMRAKADEQLIGDKLFYRDEPVCYFDTLKTSSLEGAATTVYAQGGRGNPRLMSWDGERTMTFTMEDALISPEGLAILAGAGLINASSETPAIQHIIENGEVAPSAGGEGQEALPEGAIIVSKSPYTGAEKDDNVIYVMLADPNGNPISEPFLYVYDEADSNLDAQKYVIIPRAKSTKATDKDAYHRPDYKNGEGIPYDPIDAFDHTVTPSGGEPENIPGWLKPKTHVLIDYYTSHPSDWLIIDIEPDKFGGSFYLEASTLWRDQNGVDHAAEFIIPNCRVQSNFTFAMAGSGDPSTFTFTLDAFPGFTRFNNKKKVLAEILIEGAATNNDIRVRNATDAGEKEHGGVSFNN